MNAARRQRGISLVEALVAMVVMSFGTLAVLGVQATLRANGDIAKQRSEAVRIGQQTLEQWRAYEAMEGVAEGVVYYNDIDDDESTVAGTNATYSISRVVPPESADPRTKTLVLDVGWTDRAGVAQSIRLRSMLAGSPPELSGSLVVPSGSSILRNPGGRHPSIPPEAVPQEGGTSRFTPPGAATGVAWVFDNNTGYIVQLCNAESCSPYAARLLAGFINYSLGGVPNAEVPSSPRKSEIQVTVTQTFPEALSGNVVQCYVNLVPIAYTPYYCAVPVGDLTSWSGRTRFAGLDFSNEIDDDDDDEYKVCRYTAFQSHLTVPTQMRNDQHPLDYFKVDGSLLNQNYLIITSGDGDDVTYGCPDDNTATPQIYGRTWYHQPAN